MPRALVVVMGSGLIACSILYDPDRLPSAPTIGAAGDAQLLAPDASVDAGDAPVAIDAPRAIEIDAREALDAPPIDAPPPCGGTDQACCAGSICNGALLECIDNSCRACGGALQSCCGPSNVCASGLCILGRCG